EVSLAGVGATVPQQDAHVADTAVGGLFEEWLYVRGALAQFKRYLCTGIDAFFAGNTGLARRTLSGQTPR
ncbi:hypothetical protein ABQF76_18650, partial [Xanthomonas campestris]